jgi:hypothetical protein
MQIGSGRRGDDKLEPDPDFVHTEPHMTKPLDHLVLPTRDLETARARLGSLGFTVAPQGVHPFGTINCCVYFSDGTFIEPLAVGDADAAANAVASGNAFVGRDRTFRDRNGDEGFSAVVFGSADADADDARYRAASIQGGKRLDFSRPFLDASGRQDTASFRLAFAAMPDMADAFVFACQRVNAPKVDRSALETHANGATAIREVVGVADDSARRLRFLAEVAGATADAVEGDTVRLPNAALTLCDRENFRNRFGLGASPSTLRFAAIVLAVPDIEAVSSHLAASGIDSHVNGKSLVVPSEPGQGAIFVFEEQA